jgi:hypothetical protein
MKTIEKRLLSSFRDPSGVMYSQNGKLLRQINEVYQNDYELLFSSGLYNTLTSNNMLVRHVEVDAPPLSADSCYKVIQPERIKFISYPYEWSFSQFKDAALLTLAIQKEALNAGMTLKDASAYNIQFHNGTPTLIDTLSFTKYVEGNAWVAYRQFCQHFLGPLALMSFTDIRLSKLMMNYIDGVPLDLCSRLLPFSSRFNFGLLTHIHLHAQSQKRYSTTTAGELEGQSVKRAAVSKIALIGLIESLESTVKKLTWQISKSEWADYYNATNYSDTAFDAKKQIIHDLVSELNPSLVWDLGANTGIFSQQAADIENCQIISSDIDPSAVEINYLRSKEEQRSNILPLVLDLSNPSAAIGWNNQERDSFYQRGPADVVMVLALIHHLAIANNVPLTVIANTLSVLGKYIILEFVPKEDSQVKRLLRSRDDIFHDYHLEGFIRAFEEYFSFLKQIPLPGSERTLFLLQSKRI